MPDGRTHNFSSRETSLCSPLAMRLFEVEGVKSAFFGLDFITINKVSFFPLTFWFFWLTFLFSLFFSSSFSSPFSSRTSVWNGLKFNPISILPSLTFFLLEKV